MRKLTVFVALSFLLTVALFGNASASNQPAMQSPSHFSVEDCKNEDGSTKPECEDKKDDEKPKCDEEDGEKDPECDDN